jgi:hypothetical protein
MRQGEKRARSTSALAVSSLHGLRVCNNVKAAVNLAFVCSHPNRFNASSLASRRSMEPGCSRTRTRTDCKKPPDNDRIALYPRMWNGR